ncbi:MAG: EF-Tu/IF-2/RF-3 family GTPase [Thermoplasmata archaeon]
MADSVTVAVVGGKDVARELGKKGTTSDLTLFNAVRDGHATTIVEPTQYPEKFAPLLYSLAMADQILFTIPSLSREIAETAATVDLFATPVTIALGPGVGAEEIRRAFKGTRLVDAPFVPLEPPKLRELVEGWTAASIDGPVRVPIDHAFPVKGVGAVALGVVRRGTLRAHEKLRLYPTEKVVEVRSVQVHDVDVPAASAGERVGVALKGVEADELERGQQLAPEGSLTVGTEFPGKEFVACRYYRGDFGPGAGWQLLAGLSFVPVQIGPRSGDQIALTSDRPTAFASQDRGFIADLSATTGPRIVGRLTL